jgi:hypothetical protein
VRSELNKPTSQNVACIKAAIPEDKTSNVQQVEQVIINHLHLIINHLITGKEFLIRTAVTSGNKPSFTEKLATNTALVKRWCRYSVFKKYDSITEIQNGVENVFDSDKQSYVY